MQDNIVTDGFTTWGIPNWQTLKDTVIQNKLCLFVGCITDYKVFPYMEEVRNDETCKIHEGTEWLKVSIHSDRRVFWIVDSSEWGYGRSDANFLGFIRSVFNHCGGIVKPTPPALGKRLMLEPWIQHEQMYRASQILDTDWPAEYIEPKYLKRRRRHALPPRPARMDIKDQLHGGRIEEYSDKLPGYFKLDQDNALVNHFMLHPTGTACRHYGEHEPKGVTWFVKCTVDIPHTMKLGPFPCRTPYLHWPNQKGTYNCWLWKEQVEDTKSAGCIVTIQEGWYWKHWTEDNAEWSRYMIHLRDTAPNEEVRHAIKRVTSAAISCMGIGDARYLHLPANEWNPSLGDRRLYDYKGPLNKILRTDRNSTRPTPVHWFAYTWMQVARTLYRMALPYAIDNRLVALHTDAFWVSGKVEVPDGWKLEEVLAA